MLEQIRRNRRDSWLLMFVVVVILIGQAYWQHRRIQQLQFSMEFQQRQFNEQAGKLAAERLKGHRADVMQAAQWLHQYYASDEGLRRADGNGALELHAPYGLGDVFDGVLRPNPENDAPLLFRRKAESYRRRWPWLTIVDGSPGDRL